MWSTKGSAGKKAGSNGVVAVAIDKDKNSQYALRWAVDNLVSQGRPIILIHVIVDPNSSVNNAITSASPGASPNFQHADKLTKELFLTFRCFCTRKDIRSLDITLRDTDVAKALSEYASYAAIENLVLGASRGGLIRKFKQADIPAMVSRGAPDFCNVYVISKSKISSLRKASRSVPFQSPLKSHLDSLIKEKPSIVEIVDSPPRQSLSLPGEKPFHRVLRDDQDIGRSGRINERLLFSELPESDTDLSFVSSERNSIDHFSPLHYDYMDSSRTPRISTGSDHSFGSLHFGQRANDMNSFRDFSFVSQESGMSSNASSQHGEDVENEMRRLRLELKQTMEMYSEACKEAVTAKERERQRAMDLHRWRHDEDMKMESTINLQEASMMLAERGKSNMTSESGRERTHEQYTEDTSTYSSIRYRKYSIEEIEAATNNFSESLKIGEGGYGPVFKCNLDHTKVAVKVLRPDAAQGRTQFQQEVEVLSCIRHPHMVLLLGACPEYGCIVYEHMENGSLDDRLFCRGKTPPLCWQVRFRVASEVATGLHFLHQTKPEPLVHRDLKPGNILLDRYFVSKIGDVGLARLVPPTVADHITQYCMTSAAGTFCYIDPEYQLTGMLGVKSDVYSLGVVLLQIITARPPMGLAHQVGRAIERGTFSEILDPLVPDWPVEEALCLAKLAIQCAEMRRKDRPDLGKEVLPELSRLRDFADDRTPPFMFYVNAGPSPAQSQTSAAQVSDPAGHSAASSMNPLSSTSSPKAISGEAE